MISREYGLRSATTAWGPEPEGGRWIDALHDADLLGPDLVFCHGQSFDGSELDLLAATGTTFAAN